MKKSKTFFACAMLAALASCSNDHVLSQQSPTPSDPDVINIVAASSKSATRAVENATKLQNTQFAEGEKINVYLEENGGNTTTYDMLRYEVTSTDNDGGKELKLVTTDPVQKTPYYPISGKGIDAYALYPALGTEDADYNVTKDTESFSVAIDQSKDAGYRKSDLMFGTNNWDTNNNGAQISGYEGTKKPNPVKLYFKHLLSKIIVKLLPGDGLTDIQLKGATVKLYNAYPKAKITEIQNPDGITLEVDDTSQKPDAGYILTTNYADDDVNFASGTYGGCAGIIIPQDINVPTSDPQTKFIEIILSSGGKYVYNIADGDGTSDHTMTFEQGYQYTYNMTLSAGNVVVVSTSIKDWNNKDISGTADLQ